MPHRCSRGAGIMTLLADADAHPFRHAAAHDDAPHSVTHQLHHGFAVCEPLHCAQWAAYSTDHGVPHAEPEYRRCVAALPLERGGHAECHMHH